MGCDDGLWSEVQSGLTAYPQARHLGSLACQAFNQTFVSDYSNGNLYNYSPKVYTDNGNTILREVVTRTGIIDFNTFRCGSFYLDFETGVGLRDASSQGYDPLVSIECARDMRDFGPPRLFSLGRKGEYWTRVMTRRWGRAKQMTFRIRMTDPVPFTLTSGAAMVRVRQATPARRRAA